jgi:hypothetical protein
MVAEVSGAPAMRVSGRSGRPGKRLTPGALNTGTVGTEVGVPPVLVPGAGLATAAAGTALDVGALGAVDATLLGAADGGLLGAVVGAAVRSAPGSRSGPRWASVRPRTRNWMRVP